MRLQLRSKRVVAMAGLVLAVTGLGCDWLSLTDDPVLPPGPTSPHQPTSDAAARDAAAANDAGAISDDYARMCRHYCQTLEQTDLLACVSSHGQGDLSTCVASTSSTTETCFDLRCRSGRVDLPLCFAQCDSLATFYTARCPAAGGPSDVLCPSSQADHDAACRAGCVL